MIKNIIKRDGSREAFNAEKVNGWGIWAAKSLGYIDWSSIVIDAVSQLKEETSSIELQQKLIDVCLQQKTWEYNRMAGRLYIPLLERVFYDNKIPTVKQLHKVLFDAGLMVELDYSEAEYTEIEHIINHRQDLKYPHYQIHQIRTKYALRNKVTKKEYETPQFVYMRMAMALAEKEPKSVRMTHLKNWYEHFSHNRINPPTPNFTNLGTKLNGYASCCLYTTDDTAQSLAAGDHIAYMMTCMSAGIGTHIKTRSLGDPVRGGMIQHQGKLPYYRAMVGAIGANLQNGRGGASTVYYSAFDPEVEVIQKLRNPMTPQTKRIAGCHYNFGTNKLFARKVAKNEKFAPFSYFGNEEMYEAMFEKDQSKFERMYAEYEARATVFLNARDIALGALTESYETGVQYLHFMDMNNQHTPFKDKIYLNNLCVEVAIPVKPFSSVKELYESYQEDGGEIGLCSLAGILPANIESDEQWADVAYYALKMIDVCIHKSDYVFKNLEETAKARLSAGVGIIGLAHYMAKHHKRFDDQEGRDFIHQTSETHMWHLINASLRLGKELGNAPWIHKTLWPTGWLPTDTYEKRVDTFVTTSNVRDWDSLRKQIVENGGIRNSVVSAMMPGESSSIASGTTNGVYPIREISIMKTNDTATTYWIAPEGTKLKKWYQSAWDISSPDMIKVYAIIQKWTDQAISADLYTSIKGSDKISSTEMIRDYLDIVKYGLKSRYYVNSNTSNGVDLNSTETAVDLSDDSTGECEGCKL